MVRTCWTLHHLGEKLGKGVQAIVFVYVLDVLGVGMLHTRGWGERGK